MIKNYLKIAWRNFYKQKFYTGINVFGLALGISCTMMLFLFITFHLSFDRYHIHAKRIFRLVTDLHIPDGSIDYDQGSPYILGQLIKRNAAVANETSLLSKRSFTVAVPKNQDKQSLFYEFENVAFTDNNWFKIFTYQWQAGNSSTALSNPFQAVITSNLAKKYFNTDDAVGKTIRVDKYLFTITGVLQDNPTNTDVQANLFLSIASVHTMFPEPKTFWTDISFISSKNYTYVLLNDEHESEHIDQDIKTILKRDYKDSSWLHFHLQPLEEVHFDSRYSGKISKPLLLILALVGFALILIACVNFVNMATAQSLTRAKEIATRKVLGSSRKAIFWQFITETTYVALTAALIALLATILFLPTLNNWLQLQLAVNGNALLFLTALLVVIVFSAGFYPAVILSNFKPVDALKNKIGSNNSSSKMSRQVLIVVQNIIAQTLIVCTVIIILQVQFLKNADLGFNKDAIIMVPVPDHSPAKLTYFRNQLNNYASIKSITFCYKPPSAFTQKGGSIRYDGREWEKFTVSSIIGDQDYIKTFGLKLLAGRNLYPTDSNSYIVNQQVLQKLNIKTPEQAIGHKLTAGDFSDEVGTIVGVVKDFNIQPLNTAIAPALITPKPAYYEFAAVKISGEQQQRSIEIIQQKWKKTFPQNAFEYHFLDEQLAEFYQKEEMVGKLITVGTMVAILISCLGLLGLISLMTVQRTKEIGIRKVLGATVSSIVTLISKDFVKLIAVAVLVSSPFAWLLMHHWLQNFAYRIEISWWIFAVAGTTAIVIALLTISFQSVKAALANPVESLRSE